MPFRGLEPRGHGGCTMVHELTVALSLLEESTLQRSISELADRVGEFKIEMWKATDARIYDELEADIKSAEKVLAVARRVRRVMQPCNHKLNLD